jgi:hypothetical protein
MRFSFCVAVAYEIYLLKPDFRLGEVVALQAQDDFTAIEAAKSHQHPYWRELWRGRQMVGRYPPREDEGAY